jgi:hypothetical protein
MLSAQRAMQALQAVLRNPQGLVLAVKAAAVQPIATSQLPSLAARTWQSAAPTARGWSQIHTVRIYAFMASPPISSKPVTAQPLSSALVPCRTSAPWASLQWQAGRGVRSLRRPHLRQAQQRVDAADHRAHSSGSAHAYRKQTGSRLHA